jgi:hypothetical protein
MPERARITRLSDEGATTGRPHEVDFNPASLKVTLTNRLQDEDASGGPGQARQNTRVTTSKLETELVYDTTETGDDVRTRTSELKQMAIAAPGNPPAPPSVELRWGSFSYVGVIESLDETLDFWAAEGIPLRATVKLSITNVNGAADELVGDRASAALNPISPGGTGTTGAATRAGDPKAGRALAAANGIENMRMAGGGTVAISAGVRLQAAAGFRLGAGASAGAGIGIGAEAGASGGAGFGIGATAGGGISAGFGAGAAAGLGASAGFEAGGSAAFGASAGLGTGGSAGFDLGASTSASFEAGGGFGAGAGTRTAYAASATRALGGPASAGVSATKGAFDGLGTSRTGTAYRLDPQRLLPPPSATVTSTARFDITGRVVGNGTPGITADVSVTDTRLDRED